MDLFLVQGLVEKTYYEGEKVKFTDIRLVKAENSELAGIKWQDYWERKDSPYYVSYWADVTEISGVLE